MRGTGSDRGEDIFLLLLLASPFFTFLALFSWIDPGWAGEFSRHSGKAPSFPLKATGLPGPPGMEEGSQKADLGEESG
jgi:hypothetical protein